MGHNTALHWQREGENSSDFDVLFASQSRSGKHCKVTVKLPWVFDVMSTLNRWNSGFNGFNIQSRQPGNSNNMQSPKFKALLKTATCITLPGVSWSFARHLSYYNFDIEFIDMLRWKILLLCPFLTLLLVWIFKKFHGIFMAKYHVIKISKVLVKLKNTEKNMKDCWLYAIPMWADNLLFPVA